jgi:hypothetical protein
LRCAGRGDYDTLHPDVAVQCQAQAVNRTAASTLGCPNYEALADVGQHRQRDSFRKPLDITLVPAMLDVGLLNVSGAGA